MASDVRECDVCGTVFRIGDGYEALVLPMLPTLNGIIERTKRQIKDGGGRTYVNDCQCDVCSHCLLRLCEVLQGLHSIRERPQ